MAASKSTTFSESNISTANNTSSLTINIYFSPNNTQTWFASKTLSCTCNGVTQSANVALSAGGSVSYSFTFSNIAHNSDGTKSVSWSWSCATGTSVLGTIGDSGTKTLTTIARYFTSTPTISLSSRTETTLKIKWTTSETCDRVDYKINDTTRTSAWTGSAKTGTITISNLSPNTRYSVFFWCRRKDSQLGTATATSYYTTYDYPYCSATPNFVIGDSVTLSFYNPLSRNMDVTFIAADGSEQSVGSSTGTSISGLDGTGWQDFYYQSIPNASSGKYQIKVEYGSSTKTRNNNNTYSVNGTEEPIMASSYFDYASDMTNLTNNNKTIIQGYSNVTLSLLDEAVPQFYSTISKYVFQIGDQQETLTDPLSTATISNANNNVITCTAVDSRNLTKAVSQTIPPENYVQYTTPVITSATTEREDGVKTTTVLNLSGQIYDGTFGEDGIANSVRSIKYAVSQDNETWSNWYNIDITNLVVTDGMFSIQDYNIHENGSSGGFDIGTKYYVKVYLEDEMLSTSAYIYTTTISSGIIARDVYKDSNNEYHEGINGLADEDYTQMIHGTLNVKDNIYINGTEIAFSGGGETLPVGSEIDYDGTTVPTGWEEMTDYDTGWIEIKQSDLAQGTVSSGYYAPAYRKIGNVVYLKGKVTGITTRASAIFTLPSGYYNNSNRLSFCTTNDNLEVNFIRVLNTGAVQIQQTTGTLSSGVNAFFDGISFTID